jgi:FkbM family methyltransferase
MKNSKNWVFHNEQDDLISEMVDKSYQQNHRNKILEYLQSINQPLRNCIDVGSHIGIWSYDFVNVFEWVHAFEIVKEMRECYVKNIDKKNYTLYPFGLGSEEKKVFVNYEPQHSKNTQIDPKGTYQAEIRPLDSLNLKEIDYIKMDVEGYELEVLKGATDLLSHQSPVVHLEMKKGPLEKFHLDKQTIRDWLLQYGYEQSLKISNEFVFKKNEK